MVDYLYLHGPTQVGTLARELGEQVGSISHHLRMIERAGIVAPARARHRRPHQLVAWSSPRSRGRWRTSRTTSRTARRPRRPSGSTSSTSSASSRPGSGRPSAPTPPGGARPSAPTSSR
ncbi:ArsR family transcriptional regulator [Nocardioides endophyticus]|uniref:ArsR family transcriptional regulator n=1 Tax=Nocardioides endophyticus TaxID=1353775 RepID=UPI003CD05457